jgi:hypothetical protein
MNQDHLTPLFLLLSLKVLKSLKLRTLLQRELLLQKEPIKTEVKILMVEVVVSRISRALATTAPWERNRFPLTSGERVSQERGQSTVRKWHIFGEKETPCSELKG